MVKQITHVQDLDTFAFNSAVMPHLVFPKKKKSKCPIVTVPRKKNSAKMQRCAEERKTRGRWNDKMVDGRDCVRGIYISQCTQLQEGFRYVRHRVGNSARFFTVASIVVRTSVTPSPFVPGLNPTPHHPQLPKKREKNPPKTQAHVQA